MTSNVIARRLGFILEKGAMKLADIANVLGIRPETVSRWNQGKALPQRERERQLLELEFIVEKLSDIYEPGEARLWLFSRQKLLGDETPAELIQRGRIEDVVTMVNQLRDGVYL